VNRDEKLLGFFEHNDLIILTNAFQKKSQKTPGKEIEIAERRKKDYLKLRERNERSAKILKRERQETQSLKKILRKVISLKKSGFF
jgi:hypothetical protein